MTRPISKDDLLKYLTDHVRDLPDDRREALEAELDRLVDEAVMGLERIEARPGFDRAMFARIDALDEKAQRSLFERIRVGLTWGRVGWATAAVAVCTTLAVLSFPSVYDDEPSRDAMIRFSQSDLDLADDLDLYQDLHVVENLDVLSDLDLIESLDTTEAG